MVLPDFVFALIVALFLTYFFVVLLGLRGPWLGYFGFLAVLFLAIWAAVLWIRRAGPFAYGLYWVPAVVTGLVVALLLAAAGPPRKGKVETIHQVKEREQAINRAALNLFWSVIALFALVILLGYLARNL